MPWLILNHIPRDDFFDYHPLRECYIYIKCTAWYAQVSKVLSNEGLS